MDIKDVLAERETTHGDFEEHAHVSQTLKKLCNSSDNIEHMSDVQQEALSMMCHKLARILVGDPHHADHWIDIAGYATLAARSLEED